MYNNNTTTHVAVQSSCLVIGVNMKKLYLITKFIIFSNMVHRKKDSSGFGMNENRSSPKS